MSRVGPGVFFALFGAGLVVFSLVKPVSLTVSPRAANTTSAPKSGVVAASEFKFVGLLQVRRTAANGGTDEVDLLLLRDGDDVRGGYMNPNVRGSIEGKITDGVVRFTWSEGNTQGHGKAESQGDTLRGTWGVGEAEQGGGEFNAVRQKKENSVR